MLLVDAFDAIHLEAVNRDNAEMRRIFLFRFILILTAYYRFICFLSSHTSLSDARNDSNVWLRQNR